MSARTTMAVALAVAARPGLWLVALRQANRLAGRRWWSRAPFLPLPPRNYMRFRMVTAYGADGSAAPDAVARDVVAYLRWCRTYGASSQEQH